MTRLDALKPTAAIPHAVQLLVTVDVELWCDGWIGIDAKFRNAFQQYVYGSTSDGDWALPFILRTLAAHDLRAVFFVEPLFAARFGLEPLREIVQLILASGQEIQLHLHPEWTDEAKVPLLSDRRGKRQHLHHYELIEQQQLVQHGMQLLELAGVPPPTAFRAGSFAFNRDTLAALRANGISFDCSYNETMFGLESGVRITEGRLQSCEVDGVQVFPMTVFRDGRNRKRHLQIGACSFEEMREVLEQSWRQRMEVVTVLLHNFEFLNPSQTRQDWITVRRFTRFCEFLGANRDRFETANFSSLISAVHATEVQDTRQPQLRASLPATARRVAEQGLRRLSVWN